MRTSRVVTALQANHATQHSASKALVDPKYPRISVLPKHIVLDVDSVCFYRCHSNQPTSLIPCTCRLSPISLPIFTRLCLPGPRSHDTSLYTFNQFPSQFPVMSIYTPNRTNFGPLTTTFTPGPSCSIPFCGDSTDSRAWYAKSCHVDILSSYTTADLVDDTLCYPTPTGSGSSVAEVVQDIVLGIFSPGLYCPAGYTRACEGYPGSTGIYPFQYPVTGSETAAGCCPLGFACQQDIVAAGENVTSFFQFCTSTAWSVSRTMGICTGETGPTLTEVSSSAVSRAFTVYAPMIQLVWQATDTSSSTLPGPTSTTATGTLTLSSGGLSTDAVVGIGIGGTVAVVAIIAWTTWTFLRRRRRRRRRQGRQGRQGRQWCWYRRKPMGVFNPSVHEDEANASKAELPGNRHLAHELQAEERPQELQSPARPKAAEDELGCFKGSPGRAVELEG